MRTTRGFRSIRLGNRRKSLRWTSIRPNLWVRIRRLWICLWSPCRTQILALVFYEFSPLHVEWICLCLLCATTASPDTSVKAKFAQKACYKAMWQHESLQCMTSGSSREVFEMLVCRNFSDTYEDCTALTVFRLILFWCAGTKFLPRLKVCLMTGRACVSSSAQTATGRRSGLLGPDR